MTTFRVFLCLGSNLGDRLGYLTRAAGELAKIVRIRSVSSVYETEAVGDTSQPKFLNVVLEVETQLMPPDFIRELKAIEKRVGRKDPRHLRPREIDIDILMYHGWSYEDNSVCVPHPELERRRFVLEPLSEIAPRAIHPIHGQTVSVMLRHCHDRSRVMRTFHMLPGDF